MGKVVDLREQQIVEKKNAVDGTTVIAVDSAAVVVDSIVVNGVVGAVCAVDCVSATVSVPDIIEDSVCDEAVSCLCCWWHCCLSLCCCR